MNLKSNFIHIMATFLQNFDKEWQLWHMINYAEEHYSADIWKNNEFLEYVYSCIKDLYRVCKYDSTCICEINIDPRDIWGFNDNKLKSSHYDEFFDILVRVIMDKYGELETDYPLLIDIGNRAESNPPQIFFRHLFDKFIDTCDKIVIFEDFNIRRLKNKTVYIRNMTMY
jgi:hypothetical protein